MWGYNQEMAACKPEKGPLPKMESADTLILDFPASKFMRNKLSVV